MQNAVITELKTFCFPVFIYRFCSISYQLATAVKAFTELFKDEGGSGPVLRDLGMWSSEMETLTLGQ